MAEITRRPVATLALLWNPDTGEFSIKGDGANTMEQLGMLQYAAVTLQLSIESKHSDSILTPGHVRMPV